MQKVSSKELESFVASPQAGMQVHMQAEEAGIWSGSNNVDFCCSLILSFSYLPESHLFSRPSSFLLLPCSFNYICALSVY